MTLGCGTSSKTSKTGRLKLINYINVRHYIHLLVIIPAMAMVANMMLWSMVIENLYRTEAASKLGSYHLQNCGDFADDQCKILFVCLFG